MTARDDYPFPAAVAAGRLSGGLYGQEECTAALDEIDRLRTIAAAAGELRTTLRAATFLNTAAEALPAEWRLSGDARFIAAALDRLEVLL